MLGCPFCRASNSYGRVPSMLSDQQGLQKKQRRRAEKVYWVAYCKLGCAEIDRMSEKIGAFGMGRGKGLTCPTP